MKRHMLIYKENLPTLVAVKQNLILQASSYSQKILEARVWVPIPVYRYQNRPGYVPACPSISIARATILL